jgi:multidrug resistance efflux pump
LVLVALIQLLVKTLYFHQLHQLAAVLVEWQMLMAQVAALVVEVAVKETHP